ncbi:MAG: carbohydrate binding family 9 domain-containing protein [Bacteroidia bacterium]|nr:carbohydrate binding family 9 domain-containing protein [Bacteroidia bacterium]
MIPSIASVALGVLLWAMSPYLHGQGLEGASARLVAASRCLDRTPRLDGVLDDACWLKASPATDFVLKEPREGAEPSLRTEVRFVYDDKALYVGARMYHDDVTEIVSTLSRRDNAGNSERIIISLDTYGDKRTSYSFCVTADGVRVEYYHSEDQEFSRDHSFDPVWEAAVSRDAVGWSAEMRIPFSQLRFNSRDELSWGLNMNRYVPSRNEDMYWVLIPKSETGWASRFGTLTGIRGIAPSSRIELFPYLSTDFTHSGTHDPANPLSTQSTWQGGAGVDMKMGLGPNLTLDATINPDFGQVEADPATVNLSAYEIYYDERRPFFIEGSQLLKGRGPNYFYSRRIGAPPRLTSDAPYSAKTSNTTILGAAKVSGRLQSGFSLGALTALTAREFVETWDPATSTRGETQVAPMSGYGVVRALQEIDAEGSSAGVILAGVKRDLADPKAESILTRNAVSGGADWKIRFNSGVYELNGFAGFSHVQGSSDAIALIQLSPAHYFQRPDATHVSFDPTRTSLTGYTAALNFSKIGGKNWLWGAGITAESPEFEINDTGRLQSTDDIEASTSLTYRETEPGALFHAWSLGVSQVAGWNFGGTHRFTTANLELAGTFKNFWTSAFVINYGARGVSDELTRGGPLMDAGAGINYYWSFHNNYADDFRWSGGVSGFNDETDSWNFVIDGSFALRLRGNLELSLVPSFIRQISTRQYIGTFDRGDARTYGKRYVFSTIDQATLVSRFRVNYAFTPDLTLEVYMEPFASNGRFTAFGEMAEGGERDLRIYGTDGSSLTLSEDGTSYTVREAGQPVLTLNNPDFKILSFRSNVVLRWEWLRGSTLFLVWQQNRSNYDMDGATIGPRHLLHSIDSPGDNFFAMKISYWLPVS